METATYNRSHAKQAAREGILSLQRKAKQLARLARAAESTVDPVTRGVRLARVSHERAALEREMAVVREFATDVGALDARRR